MANGEGPGNAGIDAKRVRCSLLWSLVADGASPPTCERKSKPAGDTLRWRMAKDISGTSGSRRGGEGQPLFEVSGQPLFEVSSWDFEGMWFMGLWGYVVHSFFF